MDAFDQRVRDAVGHSLAGYKVPPPPEFTLPAISRQPATTQRWIVAAAAAILIVGMATAGRTAFAQIANAVARLVEYFEVDSRGQILPVQSQSLTLAEALRLQEFRTVPPAGLPAGAMLLSIQRIGVGSSTTLMFTYDYRGTTFSIAETPANSRGMPNIGYFVRRGLDRPVDGGSAPTHQTFTLQATDWVSGTAHIALFAANVLSPDQVRRIENAMSHG